MTWATPFAYFVFMSGVGLGVALLVHLFGWYTAPERVTTFFEKD